MYEIQKPTIPIDKQGNTGYEHDMVHNMMLYVLA